MVECDLRYLRIFSVSQELLLIWQISAAAKAGLVKAGAYVLTRGGPCIVKAQRRAVGGGTSTGRAIWNFHNTENFAGSEDWY